jgi:hypothetical protein
MKKLHFLIIPFIVLSACQPKVETPVLSDKTNLNTKTITDYTTIDATQQFSEEVLLEKEMCNYLLALAKQGKIAAFKNSGPWGDKLVHIQPNEIDDALTIEEEYEVDGEFLIREKTLTVNELGPITFKESWSWDETSGKLTKQVERVTLSQLVVDEEGFVIGGRPLITLAF